MSYLSAIVILLICVIVAVVVCAPFIYSSSKKRNRPGGGEQTPNGKTLSPSQLVPVVIVVLVNFMAFAQQYIAPESWMGTRVTTIEGRFWLSILVILVIAVLNYIWFSIKAHINKPKQSAQDSKGSSVNKPSNDA